jgi:peptide/nickel transport system substrate-binding protein
MLKRIALLLALLALSVPAYAADRATKDTLTVAMSTEPNNLLPYNSTQYYAATIENMIYNTLIRRNQAGEFVGDAATSWEYLSDTVVRFKLREDMTFSNGDPMTSEDVKFTLDKGNASSYALFYNTLKEVRIVDKFTVDVETKTINAAFLSNIAQPRSAIVSKAQMEKIGESAYDRAPFGTGPFKFVEWVTGSQVVLEARDDYWGKKPAYKTLVFKFVTEGANRSIELETGSADIILEPDPNDLERLRELGMTVYVGDSYMVSQFMMNYTNVPNIKIRQALGYAVDIPTLVEAVYGEMAEPSKGFMPKLMFSYEDNVPFTYDPEKAKALVAEAAQYFWRQVGLNVNITMLDLGAFRAHENTGENQMSVGTANWMTGDPSRPLSIYAHQGGNRYKLPDAAVEKIREYFDKGLTIIDQEERTKHYREFQNFIIDQWIIFPIAQKKLAYVTTPNVANFFPAPNGSPDFFDVVVYEE